MQADLIDMLGWKSGQDFAAGVFQRNWHDMPEAAKARLFDGNPEGRALADTLAEVASDFAGRAAMDNHSNTAAASGLMAFLGAAVASPGKVVTFLTTVTGLERVVVSEAMAKAVAGERTALGDMLRRAAMNYAGTIDAQGQTGPQ